MRTSLRKRIYLNFVLLVVIFGVLGSLLGAFLINKTAVDEAQRSVKLNLRSAWGVIHGKLEELRILVSVLGTGKRVAVAYAATDPAAYRASLEAARRQCGFDFLSLTDEHGRVILRTVEPYHVGDDLSLDPFVGSALKGSVPSGLSILSAQRLRAEGGDLEERAFVAFEPTPMAKPRAKTFETSGMALMAAAPVRDDKGNIVGALYAGVLVNRNHALVDRIRSAVFEERLYYGKPLGTVTIFQWDVRVATNVTLPNGNRAIGTRVSADVYDKVLENDISWHDRAFVVDDWYISAYDPIHDLDGKTIGILYVGILARKYDDIRATLWKLYAALSVAAAALVLAIGVLFARRLSGSISGLAEAASRIATGDYNLRVPEPRSQDEVRELTQAFNAMAASLKDREERLSQTNLDLERTNEKLQRLNANYMDMLGFISHELKNTLGVIYTSALTLEKGVAGPLSEPQATLVKGISRSIQSAVSMTRNYLDLARIEKAELSTESKTLEMAEDVIRPVVEEFSPAALERGMVLERDFRGPVWILGDRALLRVVLRNLLSNAIQYGRRGGVIRIGAWQENGIAYLEVWNQGDGLAPDQMERLFEKFLRFHREGEAERKGTGLGLFISREIVRKHGGEIGVRSQQGEWISFLVSLPAQETKDDAVAPSSSR
jgi:two-component system NtrC family sensor kinase